MQKVSLVGSLYQLELEGDRYDFEDSFGIGYMEHTSYYFRWRGNGRLTRFSDQASWKFAFKTPAINKWSNWSGFYRVSLERNVFITIDGESRKPVDHNKIIDLKKVVDMLVEDIFRQTRKSQERIPPVFIDPLDINELRKLGVLPMPDGQFAMAELTKE
ncbi:MAG: hypothetical protein NTY30_01750 [Candidatus Berkelbacteria bacterium]|nr:hypothetical protein [Candidatus Berkelbacteria bacterium]